MMEMLQLYIFFELASNTYSILEKFLKNKTQGESCILSSNFSENLKEPI